MSLLIEIVVLVLMAGSLFLIPLGLPGLWISTGFILGLAAWGTVSWVLFIAAALAAGAAEVGELAVVRSFGKRYGGSSRAFWGALLGGVAGLFVGIPLPVVGPIISAFLGSFLGAGIATWLETRSLSRSGRVAWGVVLARSVSIALRVAVGAALLAATALALLF